MGEAVQYHHDSLLSACLSPLLFLCLHLNRRAPLIKKIDNVSRQSIHRVGNYYCYIKKKKQNHQEQETSHKVAPVANPTNETDKDTEMALLLPLELPLPLPPPLLLALFGEDDEKEELPEVFSPGAFEPLLASTFNRIPGNSLPVWSYTVWGVVVEKTSTSWPVLAPSKPWSIMSWTLSGRDGRSKVSRKEFDFEFSMRPDLQGGDLTEVWECFTVWTFFISSLVYRILRFS